MGGISVSELNRIKEESYDKWFERWYKKQDVANYIKVAAMKGYSSYSYNISDIEDNYLRRRMRNQRFIEKLKEKLGGFDVYRVEPKKIERNLMGHNLNLGWTPLKVVISWSEADLNE